MWLTWSAPPWWPWLFFSVVWVALKQQQNGLCSSDQVLGRVQKWNMCECTSQDISTVILFEPFIFLKNSIARCVRHPSQKWFEIFEYEAGQNYSVFIDYASFLIYLPCIYVTSRVIVEHYHSTHPNSRSWCYDCHSYSHSFVNLTAVGRMSQLNSVVIQALFSE